MNYAGKFGPSQADQGSIDHVDFDLFPHRGEAVAFTVSDAHLLFSGNYERHGRDLIISDQTHHLVVPNYFSGNKRPLLVSPEGAPLDPAIVDALTGHTQYAQAGGSPAGKVVGHIAKMTGSASIVRNGVTIDVQVGDAVYQSDVLQTGSSSTVGLVLVDGTAFNLSANARLMLNDLTYDASSTSNSSFITLVQGAASFVAGQVAKTGDMKVATPAAVIGVRGTAVKLDIASTDGRVDISVIDQQDGQVHAVDVFKCVPTGVTDPQTGATCSAGDRIGTVTSNGPSLSVTPTTTFDVVVQQNNKTPAQIAQEFNAFQATIETYNIQKQINPNLPQHTENGGGNNPSPGTKYASLGSTPPDPPATDSFAEGKGLAVQALVTDLEIQAADTVPATGRVVTSVAVPAVSTSSSTANNTGTDSPLTLPLNTAAPQVTARLAFDTGTSTDIIASNNATLSGTGLANTAVNFTVDGSPIATTVMADANGVWSFTPSGLADGAHTIVASQTDGFGNTGAASLSFTLDTTAPSGGTPNLEASDTGSSSIDNITAATTPTFVALLSSSVAAGDTVQLLLNGSPLPHPAKHLITSADVLAGRVSLAVTAGDLGADGSKAVAAQFSDAAGNSSISSPLSFVLDTMAPVVAITSGGGLTNVAAQTITGTADVADAGRIVTVFNGAVPVGSAIVQSNGSWNSSVTLNNGSNTLSAQVSDLAGNLGTSNSITYTVNDAPATTPVTLVAIAEDSGARLITQAELLANATDVDGPALTAINLAISAGNGTLVNNGNGTWSYTPALNDDTAVTFSYAVSDGIAAPVATTASLDITPVSETNLPPVTTPVTLVAIAEDSGARLITQAELLANATDVDGPALTAINLAISAGNGTLVNNGNGTWSYTPALNDDTAVTFSYAVSDGIAAPVATTASLDITPVSETNLPPVTTPVTLVAIAEDSGARLITQAELLANATDVDGPALTAINLAISAGNGTLVNNGNGTWSYTPALNDDTAVTFSYAVSDGIAAPVATTASLDITPVNDAPATTPVTLVAIAEDSGARLITQAELLANATDVDGPALTAINLAISAGNGTLVNNGNGTWSYTPALNDDTAVTFSYAVSDGIAAPVATTASLDITPVNDAPATTPVTLVAIAEDSGARLITQAELLANATDVDGPALTAINLAISAGNGTLVNNGNGTWSYTPALNDDTAVTFSYAVSDGIAAPVATTASLDITPVSETNLPPVTTPVTLVAIAEDSGARLITQAELLANATDVDGPALTAINLAISAGNGTLVNNGNGTWSYTPALNDDTAVTFSYAVSDGIAAPVATTASLDITPVSETNLPPVTTPVTLVAIAEDSGARLITQAELLANATDVDGPALTAINLAISAGNGTLVNNGNGTWSYTPALNDDTAVTFSYAVSDGIAAPVATTASLDITPVNDAPATTPVTLVAIAEDSGARLITQAELLANATDVDGPALTAINLAISAGNGTLVNNGNGTWSYTPALNDDTAVTFSYAVSDGIAAPVATTASLDITPVNDAPATTPVTLVAIAEDSGARLITQAELLANATDVDGPALTAINLAISAGNGTLVNNGNGTWSYTPALNDDTAVTFSYAVSDGIAAPVATTASLDITPVNDAPATTPVTLVAIAEDSGARLITQAELLANATDVDGPALTAINLAISAGNGTLVNNGNGTWSYTPALNDDTAVTFSYAVSDGIAAPVATTASLDITPVSETNLPPVTTPVTLVAIAEDSGARLITQAELLANATDVDGPALTAINLAISAGNGTLVNNGNGTWSYTPALNDDTAVTFSYAVSDGIAAPVATTASLDITPVNDAPATTPVTLVAIAEDSGARLITQAELLANATDVDGPALTAINLAISAGNGTLVNNGNGTWSYTPAANDDTAVTFSYAVSDGIAAPVATTASLDITPVNDAPATTPVTLVAIAEDSGARLITQAELLANATDVDGPALTAINLAISAGNGTLVNNGNGTWSYTPALNDDTAVTFSYAVSDGIAAPVATTASLDITPVNDAPATTPVTLVAIAEDSGARLITQAELLANATDVDGPALTAINLAISAGNGTLVNNGNGTWSYTPALNDDTAVTFSYAVSDGIAAPVATTASLDITPVSETNLPPVTTPVTLVAIAEDSGARLITQAELLANATDVDGPALTAINLAISAGNGTLVNNGNGTWSYTPALNDDTAVTFSYAVSDGIAAPVATTASLDITPVNDAPATTPVTLVAIAEDSGARLITQAELLANATDVDGPALTAINLAISAGNGTLVNNGNGTWSYTPALNDDTAVTFSYAVSDGIAAPVATTASLDITPVNDAPATTPVTLVAIAEDSGARLITQAELLANATDVDGPALTAINLAISAGNGTLVNNGNGTWSYTPALNDDTAVTFSYAVSDGIAAPVATTASLDITPVNDAPATTPVTLVAIAEDSGARLITQAELLANATDVDGPALTAINLAISAGNGTLVNNGNGTWSYTPALNDDTAVTFSYAVSDGIAAPVATTASLDITPVNDAPATTPVTLVAIAEDSGARLITQAELLANATDVDGPALTAINLAISAGNGTLVNNGNGTWSYTPALNDDTAVTFSYAVSDGIAAPVATTASLDITPVSETNLPPVTTPVTLVAIAEDSGARLITQAELLANATDVDGPALTAINLAISAGNGTLVNNGNGTWSYTPALNDDTAVTFSYAVSDGIAAPVATTASLDITPVNDAPATTPVTLVAIAEDSGARLITQAELLANATDVDGPALTAINLAISAGNGTLVNNGNGTWSYTPALNDDTAVTFSYAVSDGIAAPVATTASLDITPVNDAPATTPVTLVAIAEDSGARLITQAELLANATDVDGPALTAINLAISAGNGTLVNNGNGTWSYTPALNDDTAVTFSYAVSDGIAAPVATTASLDITPVNDAPATTPVTLVAIAEDSGARLITQAELLANATDVDGPALTAINLAISAGNGTLVNNGNGTWSYTPAANDDTAVTFSYAVSDGIAAPVATSASLDITPVNDALAITAIATDSGTAGDFITNDTTLTVSGTNGVLGAGEKIQVSSDGGATWTDVVQNGTTWSLVDTVAHPASFTYQARIIDGAGNIGTTVSQAVTIDTSAPVAALAITAIATDSGTAGDFITNDTTLTVSGTNGVLGAGEKIQVSSDGGATWTDVVQNGTTWSLVDAVAHPASFTYQARIIDGAGNIGTTASQAVTIDTSAPVAALAITAIATDSGTAGDFITNDTTLTVSGTNGVLGAGEKIQVSSDGGATWTDVVQNGTTWSLVDTVAHPASFTYQARIIDGAGNIGTTASQAVTIDTSAPVAALAITAIATDSGTAGDFITNDTTLTVSGTNGVLGAGEKIQISSDGGATWTDVVQNGTTWSLVDTVAHPASFTYQARIIDGAGNIGTTASQAVTIDTSAPVAALAITAIATDSGTAGDFITNDTTLTVSGTNGVLGAGEKIQVSSDGGATWTDVVQNGTTWSLVDAVTHPASFTYQARIIDGAGNIGTTVSQAVTIDTSAPVAALAITAIATDSGTAGDFITNDTTLTVSGTNGVLGAGEKIQVSSDGGATWTDVVQNGTTWSLVDTVAHPASFTYQARIIDGAGNIGTTASQAVTIDTSAPVAALAITAIATDSGTAGDFITNDTTLTVSGTNGVLGAGEKIQISSDGGATWTDVVQNGTTWSLVDTVAHPASFTYQARIIDGAGNIGTTVSQAVTIDTSAPVAALAITAIATDSGTAGDFITNDTTLTVSGTNGVLGAGEKIQVSSDGGATWTDVVQNGTTWSLVDAVAHPASFTYQARIIDGAGNIGTTVSQAVTIDTSAPVAALAITAIATDSGTAGDFITNDTTLTVSGTNGVLGAGEKIQVSSDGGATWTDVVQNGTTWSLVDAVAHPASFTYQARIIDGAGNIGTTASQAVTIDTSAPVAALAITAIAGSSSPNVTSITVSGSNGALANSDKVQISSDGGATWTDVVQNTATSWSFVDNVIHTADYTYRTRIIDSAANVGIVTLPQSVRVINNGSTVSVGASSALVTGTAGGTLQLSPGITGTVNVISIATGPVAVTGGGSVTSATGDAIDLSATGSTQAAPANLSINLTGPITGAASGITAVQNAFGSLTITTSGPVIGHAGQGISGQQGTTGVGNILVNGPGNVTGTGAGFNGILAQNLNAANNGDVTISQTGNISGGRDGIRAQTNGNGNITVTTGSNATITGSLLYGIEAVSNGRGTIAITTATGDTINSGSVGINVYNQATSIPQVGGLTNSFISVTANGTINSGTTYTGGGARPAGILAGYKGGTTNTSNSTAFGNVTVDNFANINAAGGDGIRAYNFGPGDVTVNNHGGTIVARDMFGITASSNSTGKVSITMEAGAVINSGSSAIQAINLAAAVPVGAQSTISVTAAGTIHSGYHLTPGGAQPQAISAGYYPGNSGVSNTNVNGTVFVDNFANVIADAGTGVNAYNYGNGSVTLINEANTSVSGAQYGITAFSSSLGTGSVTINVGSNAAITAGSLYGLAGILGGINNSGNVSITTSAGDVINSGGTGIQANSSATSAASSQVSVTTLGGTINSGFNSNGNQPGGIWAGYNAGGQGLVNSNLHGNVTVDNAANINAASGVGIGLYNFGVGNLSATIRPTSTISAISAGVNAFAQGGGSVSIVNQGVIIANGGAGITAGTGNSLSAVISINNSGAITSLGSSASPAIQINNASMQAAILTNSGTITANLFGKAASSVAVATYNGSVAITNTGTISGNVSLGSATINNAAGGTWRVSGTNLLGSAASITNAGTIAIYGLSYFNAAVLFALANSGTINLQANSTAIVNANVTGAGAFNIGDRSMLELVGSVAAGQTISFTAGGRGVLTLDNFSNFQGSISGLASGDVINLGGITISSASLTANTLTINATLTPVTSVQPNTMLNVLASDKIVVVPTTAVTITGQTTPYSSSPSSAQTYIFANDAIVSPTTATSGININAPLAVNPADTIFVNINQTSSVSLPAPATGSGATPAGVNITTGGASIVLMNAGNINLAGNVNATGGSGIFTNSQAGSTDILNYGSVSGNNVGISARTSGTGLLNIVVGNSATVTGTTSHGIVAISTLGAVKVTTLSGAVINSNAVGILVQNQGTSVPQGVLAGSNSSISISTSFGTINAGTHGISAGYLTNTTSPATIPDPPNTLVYGDVNIDNNANITARSGVGIIAANYGVGNIAVSTAGSITATAAGTTIPGTTQTQFGVSAFNYGSGSTTVTTGPGSSIVSGGTGLNVGSQASAVALGAASTVTVVALGSIHSGPNNNNSGTAPAGILAGFNPKQAGVFNGSVFGDVFVFAGGNITADAGDGIDAYNYGIGNISVNVGFNVSIQALTSATAQSGNAPYGIGAFNYGPGDIHVTTSSGDVVNSGSSGINASNQSNSIAANQGAMVTVSAAGSIHSGTINNNGGALPSGITAGFLGGTSSTPNLSVNGIVIVNNAANIVADAGYGINAYNYGNGDITVNNAAATTVSGAQYGITAHSESNGGTGDVAINVYAGATINSTNSYGIFAFTSGRGRISVITAAGATINSGSVGIDAVNQASAVPAADNSSIIVTASGAINSGSNLTGTGNPSAGIIAGYLGPTPGGVITATYPLTAINGEVVVNNFANINAASGDGIRAFNFGIGNVTVNEFAGTITTHASPANGYGIGISATNNGTGDIHVNTSAGTVINAAASGIAALNRSPDLANTTTIVPSSAVVSVLAFGSITSGTILAGSGDPSAGILAGYNPSNANTTNSNVHGNVIIDSYASITAAAGTDGIRGVNYGTGDITIVVESGASISAGRYGVAALGYNGGNVSITNFGLVTGSTYAVNATTTSSGKAVIDNFGHLVGNATGYNATLTNEIGGDWSLNGSSVFTGTSTLVNSGLIDSNGVSTISGLLTITNTGTFEVQSGILTVGGPMTGSGNVVIYGATMKFAAASDANVQFTSTASGTLVLDDALHFTGTVTGFSSGDTIDLAGIAPANVSVTDSGHLQVNYGTGSFELIGDYDPAGFAISSDGGTGTNITWNHQTPVILTNNLTTAANANGTTQILGVQVTDIDPAASSETFHFAATTGAALSGTSIAPSVDSGSLTHINSVLASGLTYQPGGSPPATDMMTLTVTDGFGATDSVHFVFNQVGSGSNSTLQGTSGKDVILATNSQDVLTGGAGQDQFLFAPTSSGPPVQHTITDFEMGIDKLDVRQFSGLSTSSIPGAIQQQGSDTLITLDAHDTLLLKNVFAANVHTSDFIVHS